MTDYIQDDAKIDGIKIHYYRSGGKKPPFLLLHGASDSGLCWGRTAEALSEKYDVVMWDAQGHGLSARLDKGFTFASHTKQAAGLIKALGLKKPVVMGHSMGAGTAANLASEYPTLTGAIILEDPPWGLPPPPPPTTQEAQQQQEGFRHYLKELGKRRIHDIVMESQKTDPTWDESERLPWATAKKQYDNHLLEMMPINPRPYEEIVASIQCPTLLVTSERGLVTKEAAEKCSLAWKSKNPFKWVRIEGAAHNIRREQYNAFIKAVEEFLAAL